MRTSKKVVEAISVQQFEEAIAQYAKASLRENDITQALETEMNRIREKYSGELVYLAGQKKSMLELIETYCREQKSALFSRRRSISTLYGTVGYRLGMPKLKTAKGVTWKTILETLKEHLPDYVRRTEEPAKDLLLADRNKEHVAGMLKEMGLEVVQDELFFIELKQAVAQKL